MAFLSTKGETRNEVMVKVLKYSEKEKRKFVFLNGSYLNMTKDELLDLSVSKDVIPYYVIGYFYIFFFNVYGFLPSIPSNLVGLLHLFIFSSTTLMFYALCILYDFVKNFLKVSGPIYVSIPMAISNALVGVIIHVIVYLFFDEAQSIVSLIGAIFYNFIISEILIFMFATYTLPKISSQRYHSEKSDYTVELQYVSLFGKKVNPDSVMYIISDDAYVKIFTKDKVHHVIGKISDTPDVMRHRGYLCHRSYWINKNYVEAISWKGNFIHMVRMVDGRTIPVAKVKSKVIEELLLSNSMIKFSEF